MKNYNLTNRKSAEAKKEISRIISTHEEYRNSYFMYAPSAASMRRNMEDKFINSNPDVCFAKGDTKVIVSMTLNVSCNHVYYKLNVVTESIDKDGAMIKSNGTIRTVKNLLK